MGIVKLTKSSLIDPQDTGLKPVANPPCLASETAVSLNLTIPAGCLHADMGNVGEVASGCQGRS